MSKKLKCLFMFTGLGGCFYECRRILPVDFGGFMHLVCHNREYTFVSPTSTHPGIQTKGGYTVYWLGRPTPYSFESNNSLTSQELRTLTDTSWLEALLVEGQTKKSSWWKLSGLDKKSPLGLYDVKAKGVKVQFDIGHGLEDFYLIRGRDLEE